MNTLNGGLRTSSFLKNNNTASLFLATTTLLCLCDSLLLLGSFPVPIRCLQMGVHALCVNGGGAQMVAIDTLGCVNP